MNPQQFISASRPQRKTRAEELVERIRLNYLACHQGKQPGHEVALYLCAPFGEYRVQTLFAQSENILLMNIRSDGEHPDILYCPVEMAAFRIAHYIPRKPEDDNYKVLVGFGSALDQVKAKEGQSQDTSSAS